MTEDELKLMKSSMSGDFARSLEEPATIAGFAYNIIKNKLAKDYYQTYLKRLEAVSKEDVLNSAQGYIPVDKYTIVVVGNENVLDKIKLFDADGKIEMLDAFGKPAKEMKKAVLSKEQVIEKYLLATTQSSSLKAASKKIKKIKSTSEVATLTSSQIPLPLTSTRVRTLS